MYQRGVSLQGARTAEQELPHRSVAESLLHSRIEQDEVQEEERGASTVWAEL